MIRIVATLAFQLTCLLVSCFCVWTIICARKTGEDRMKVLECLRHRAMTWGYLMAELERVTFNQHMWAVVRFRDPWKLYNPIVPDAIKNPRTEVVEIGTMPGVPSDAPPAVH